MTNRIVRQPILLPLTVGLLTFCCAARADSLVYDFEQEGTRTVLAQLELLTLPATHEEVIGLTFTPTGQEFFGYDFAMYPGTFDINCFPFIDDGMGGLTGEEYCFTDPPYIQSSDPPQSSLAPLTKSFLITAFDVDTLDLWLADDDDTNFFVTATGDWRIVPEPTGLFAVLWGVLVVPRLAARRRQKCASKGMRITPVSS